MDINYECHLFIDLQICSAIVFWKKKLFLYFCMIPIYNDFSSEISVYTTESKQWPSINSDENFALISLCYGKPSD